MDCTKVGKLIASLRKEKHMTQKALAEAMHLSDRTISKWERGLGCPDVTLLRSLSELLGVNVEQILVGDLSPNEKDGGNMKKIKFYACPQCGNVVWGTGEAELSCCGRKLAALEVQKADEGHEVEIEEVEDDYYMTINHEMTKAHFISFVAYVRYDRVLIVKLYPEQNVEVRFPKMSKGNIYAYCTQHGLIKLK